ncbi:S49 family peptidase, partial [candidate division KSB1 bacterium]|nr:S49 family peptidase [candidate division KSB1 bacterium]
MIRRLFIGLWLLMLFTVSLQGQSRIPGYYQQADFLMTAPGVFGNGLVGYVNPATLTYLPGWEMQYWQATADGQFAKNDRWGFFMGSPGAGFGMFRTPLQIDSTTIKTVTDYRLSFGGGDEAFSFGLGYGWSQGDLDYFQRSRVFSLGMLVRPNRYLSLGYSGSFAWKNPDNESIFELGMRPLGTDFLTLFGDFARQHPAPWRDGNWSVGAAVKVFPGLNLTARYFDSQAFTAGIVLNVGMVGAASQVRYDDAQKRDQVYYGFRLGSSEATMLEKSIFNQRRYLKLNLKGNVGYLKYRWFDDATKPLLPILRTLQQAIDDPTVGGVVINLTGINVNHELAWEIREKLKAVRAADKQVLVYLVDGEMVEYHLASVANRIIMDPDGMLLLKGYVMGRTFQKGALEKLGLGYDEWRLFKYKSAVEALSREQMSDADREQRQAILDGFYEVVRGDICASRKITPADFDKLINEQVFYMPQQAVAAGLVDTLARWNALEEILKKTTGGKKYLIEAGDLTPTKVVRPVWGPRPRIAVVYALGPCDMETGINAVKLEQVFKNLTEDAQVKAVVFRVDSPGGAILPSDIVAEAMKKCAEKKPVIVSQGQVAASGGYWISMNADTIVAAPQTVTGSIGVIGGWLWNERLGAKLGLTSDFVKVGDHADLTFGITLPFLGMQIPDRNLTPEERTKIVAVIKEWYQEFKTKVAQGRQLSAEAVEEVAQGRVWTGLAG